MLFRSAEWLSKVKGGCGEKPRENLPCKDQANEYLMMGLRVRDGIDLDRIEALGGEPLSVSARNHLKELGMIEETGSRLFVTNQGFNVLNAIISELAF